MRKPGPQTFDYEKERKRFETWAGQIGVPWDDRVFEDLVAFHGLKSVVADLEVAYLNEQRKVSP